ncbi:dihydrofolate reductase family protein [Adhaeribacter pallidiroseus]|uniref:Dihydrofolate reductase n=1 Tax=Adhaeribacter pallidiroseus TaxID=2072847 RepID=A0A369QMI4_9BACT|nr:dihydrofolate reductase family protein [Adhaeribacter pallidiroseus]RDC64416.1 Dihydrofolate reductase [Adhaeribacter pallidiroseus]
MRKLIVSMNITLDGFLSGPNCELDWHFTSWTAEMAEALCEQLKKADTILLGRVTYLAMAKFWPAKALDSTVAPADLIFIRMMNQYPKIVFSKMLFTTAWNNSIIQKNLASTIQNLKKQSGKDLMVYGSATLVAALVHLNLVDEYQLWVHPIVLGRGKPLFKNVPGQSRLTLLKNQLFSSGVVLLMYQVQNPGNPIKNRKNKNNHEKEIAD